MRRPHVIIIAAVLLITAATIAAMTRESRNAREAPGSHRDVAAKSETVPVFSPTPAQWALLATEPVQAKIFRSGLSTEGKIAINEDTATPVFSPYPGRVTRLLAKPGDEVKAGQPLFMVEALDMVQAQNDFLSAVASLTKARSGFEIKKIIET